MTTEISINQEHQIRDIGKRFFIRPKNNIDGSIIFSDNSGFSKAYTLNKYQYIEFDIDEMKKNEWISFDPIFVEFRTSDNIEEISIDIATVNQERKLIP
jgi:hypothetical protein